MLELINVTKSFEALSEPVLHNFNLKIDKGDYCIILGTNGSGKSTLFKLISGEFKATSGAIIFNDRNITGLPITVRSKFISTVCQDIIHGTIGEMSLLENLTLSFIKGRKAGFNNYKTASKPILEYLKSVNLNLEKYIDSKMSALSGGQRQSIATIMAINPVPDMLLLDEHTSALDPKSKKQLLEFTDKLIRREKITSLMITHNIDDAILYGNRLIILDKGKKCMDIAGEEKAKITREKIFEVLITNKGEIL